MKKFRVWAKSVSMCYIDVDAEDEESAVEMAEEIDGGEFIDSPQHGYWEVLDDEVEELNPPKSL